MNIWERGLVSVLLMVAPAICFAESQSTAHSIGRVIGMVFFGYLVLKFLNRKKT